MPAKPSQMIASLKEMLVKAHEAPSRARSGVGCRGSIPGSSGRASVLEQVIMSCAVGGPL